jgi:excisionase family DNA binding protein
VLPRTRTNRGDSAGAPDRKSSVPDGLLTIQDVADYTKVSYWTARGWIESGKLPVLRLPGRLIRIRPSALERFLETECGA